MSMALHPRAILDLIKTLDQDVASPKSFASALTGALRHLRDGWPSTEFVRAYGPDLSLLAATDSAPIAEIPEAAAQWSAPFHEDGLWRIPMITGGQTWGILEIKTDAPDAEDWLRLVAAYLAQALALQQAAANAVRLEQQVTISQSLGDLSTVIGIAQDEQQLFQQSAQAFVSALNVDYCWIATLDSSRERGTVFCEYPHRGQTGQPFTLTDLPIITRPDPDRPLSIVVNDVNADSRLSESGREMLTTGGVRAFMLMPLFSRGHLAGLIRLDIRDETRHFTSEMQEAAQTMLAQVVVGLQNIRLLEETQRRSEQIQRINDFGQTLQSTLDMPIILETALQESRQMLPVERMSIALYDYDTERLRTAALYANDEYYVTPVNGAEVEMTGSVVERAWRSRAMAHIPDMTREIGNTTDEMPELRSLLVLPLVTRAGVMGLVSVGHGQPYAYSETDIIVFQQMMAQFAAAIENATLYERTQRIARREALMNEISGRLQGAGSVETAMTEAARSLQQVLGSERVSIRLGVPPAANRKDGDA